MIRIIVLSIVMIFIIGAIIGYFLDINAKDNDGDYYGNNNTSLN